MDTMICACDECGGRFRLKHEFAGKKIRCPKCKAVISVPQAEHGDEPPTKTKSPKPPAKQSKASPPNLSASARDSDEGIEQREDDRPPRKQRDKAPARERDARRDKEDFEADDRPRPRRSSEDRDELDNDRPRRKGPRNREERDDDRPRRGRKRRKKQSGLGPVIGALVAVVVLGVGGLSAAWMLGMFGSGEQKPPRQVVTGPNKRPPKVIRPGGGPNKKNPNKKNPNKKNPNKGKSDPQLVSEKTFRGTLPMVVHPLTVKKGELYEIRAEGADRRPEVLLTPGASTRAPENNNAPNLEARYLFANKDGTHQVMLRPPVILEDEPASFNYTLTLTRIPLQTKPVFDVSDKITTKDPFDKKSSTYSKTYKLKLSSKQTYIIDMDSRGLNKLDTYLVLRNAKNEFLKQDDDSGEGLNARIVFRPSRDGTYLINATTAGRRATGEFRLHIRAGVPQTEIPQKNRTKFQGVLGGARHRFRVQSGEMYRATISADGCEPRIFMRPGNLGRLSVSFDSLNEIPQGF